MAVPRISSHIIKKGNVGVRIIDVSRSYDPQTGAQVEITYQGLKAPIENMAASALGQGARGRSFQLEGPVYRAVLTYGDGQDGAAETPVDRWERVTEYIQEDLRFNLNLITLFGGSFNLTAAYKEVKAAIDAGGASFSDPNKQALFDLLAFGTTHHEIKRFVLRRRRMMSLTYAGINQANATEKVYSTAALVTAYQVPQAIAAKLPANGPAAPANFQWAWKERQDNSQDMPAYNRTEEVKDWVFAPWSTILYTYTG